MPESIPQVYAIKYPRKISASNNIENVLDSFTMSNTEYVTTFFRLDWLIAAKELIDASAADAEISEKLLDGADGIFSKINGENLYCVIDENVSSRIMP